MVPRAWPHKREPVGASTLSLSIQLQVTIPVSVRSLLAQASLFRDLEVRRAH